MILTRFFEKKSYPEHFWMEGYSCQTSVTHFSFVFLFLFLLLFFFFDLSAVSECSALEYVRFKTETGEEKTCCGKILIDYLDEETGDGLLSILEQNGRLVQIRPKEILERHSDETAFKPYSKVEMVHSLQEEFGDKFQINTSAHFVFVYNTRKAYAQWCSDLFEALYESFDAFWTKKEFPLEECPFPMVVLIYSNQKDFIAYAERETANAEKMPAYYHRFSNRVALYDLSEYEQNADLNDKRARTSKIIDEILARPKAEFSVATVVHEATHQIAFNRQMFLRTGPYPLWLAEGVSMFFETPDLDRTIGWNKNRTTAKINPLRLRQLQDIFRKGTQDPLGKVIEEEKFFQNTSDSYAISWGLFYYLNKKEPKKLVQYMKLIAGKHPYTVYNKEDRRQDFETVFGDNWERFYRDFVKTINAAR